MFVMPFGVATRRFDGKISVNATPASAAVLADGFVMVIVIMLTPFEAMRFGAKAFVAVGGATVTCGFPVSDPVLLLKFVSPP